MRKKKYYVVGRVDSTKKLNIGGTIKLEWAEGMIGAMPVFRRKLDAKRYAKDGGFEIYTLSEIPNQVKP